MSFIHNKPKGNLIEEEIEASQQPYYYHLETNKDRYVYAEIHTCTSVTDTQAQAQSASRSLAADVAQVPKSAMRRPGRRVVRKSKSAAVFCVSQVPLLQLSTIARFLRPSAMRGRPVFLYLFPLPFVKLFLFKTLACPPPRRCLPPPSYFLCEHIRTCISTRTCISVLPPVCMYIHQQCTPHDLGG